MPRTISTALQSHLQGDLTTLATCVKLTRRDATTFGFTSADQDLTIGGLTYRAVNGLGSTAIQSNTGTGVDNLEVAGILDDDRITEADILAGRYDGAEVVFSRVNWADLTMGAVTLFRGVFGEITLRDGQFQVELRSLTQRLKQSIGDLTSPTCRCRKLGDAQCKVDLTGFQFTRTVTTVVSPGTLQFAADTQPSGYYDSGLLTLTTGPNTDLTREIKTHAIVAGVAQLDLRTNFPFPISVGDTATLEAGCDRRFATCRDKFANNLNFHGEPLLPGNDAILKVARPPG